MLEWSQARSRKGIQRHKAEAAANRQHHEGGGSVQPGGGLVEEEQLDSAVDALAATLLKNAPAAVSLSKQLATRVAAGNINDQLIQETVKSIADVRDSDEGREGLNAFLEKRAPSWQQS